MVKSIAELAHIESVEEAESVTQTGQEMYEFAAPFLSSNSGGSEQEGLGAMAFSGLVLEAAGILAKEELEAK